MSKVDLSYDWLVQAGANGEFQEYVIAGGLDEDAVAEGLLHPRVREPTASLLEKYPPILEHI